MTDKERTAIAMLRSGSSWKEAADFLGVAVEEIRKLYDAAMASNN